MSHYVSAPWTKFVHAKQVKQWPELGHFTLIMILLYIPVSSEERPKPS